MSNQSRVPKILPVILFLELVALGATFPVIAYFVRELGGSAAHVTLCFFLTAAPKVVLQPIWGIVSDRIGRRAVMTIGLAGAVVSYAGWAIAPSLPWLLLSRAFLGLFGTGLTLATSIVADRLPPEERAKGIGILGAVAGLGFIIGPLAGGIIAAKTSYWFVGWVNAGLEGIALILALAILPETAPPSRGPAPRALDSLRVWSKGLSHAALGPLLLAVLAGTAGFSVIQGTLVVLAEDRWGFGVDRMGKLLALFFLVGALVQGGFLRPLVPRYGERRLAQVGSILTAAGIALLIPDGTVVILWVALLLIAVGSSLVTPTVTAMLSKFTSAQDQGSVQGLNQGMTGLGRSVSGLTMGWLYDIGGAAIPFAVSAILAFVGYLFLIRIPAVREKAPLFTVGKSDSSQS